MAKLKKIHFYYGGILDALCQYNPDASPVLVSHEESRQIYKVMTNTSQDCILFLKYASPKSNSKNENDVSYLFSFTDDDKQKLRFYGEEREYPVFLYLLCKRPELKNSEIIVLKYDEYKNVEENQSITIRIQKNKNDVLLFKRGSKSRDNAYRIQRNRIKKTFDELMNETMKESSSIGRGFKSSQMDSFIDMGMKVYENSFSCPFCENTLKNIHIHNEEKNLEARTCLVCKRKFVNKDQYKIIRQYCGKNKLIPELYIMDFVENEGMKDLIFTEKTISTNLDDDKTFYVMDSESNICPIHKIKMETRLMQFGLKLKDTACYCKWCNKYIISESQHAFLSKRKMTYNLKFKNLEK